MSVSSSDEEEFTSLYDTKTVTSRFNAQLQYLVKTQLKKKENKNNDIPKSIPEKELFVKKDSFPEKSEVHSSDLGTIKELNNKIPEEESRDSTDSVISLGEVQNESSPRLDEPDQWPGIYDPPARSTRSQRKNLNTQNQSLGKNSPVKKKKRGTIENYFKTVSNSNKNVLDKNPEVICIENEEKEEEKEEENEENENFELNVKIFWKSTRVRKFTLRKFQKFSKIFEQFMKEENVPLDKIILTLKGQKVKPTDTPDTINLKVFDIIDGGILSNTFNSNISTGETQVDDENVVILKFQDNNKKIVKSKLNKNDKMKIVMLKYAEQIEVPVENIKFFFDDEIIDPSETPVTLGLENEDVIDVKFSQKH